MVSEVSDNSEDIKFNMPEEIKFGQIEETQGIAPKKNI